jgi:hypothetical protein
MYISLYQVVKAVPPSAGAPARRRRRRILPKGGAPPPTTGACRGMPAGAGEAAQQVREAALELTRQGTGLCAEIERFLARIGG